MSLEKGSPAKNDASSPAQNPNLFRLPTAGGVRDHCRIPDMRSPTPHSSLRAEIIQPVYQFVQKHSHICNF